MGTPDFAVPSLVALSTSGHQVVRVVTRPDAPKGRGLKLTESAVKTAAKELAIPVSDVVNMKDEAFLADMKALAPDLFCVIAFKILPGITLQIPTLGAVNVHPSLLPKYRGAAPINWAIANGEVETGITVFRLGAVIDGGDILCQEKFAIHGSGLSRFRRLINYANVLSTMMKFA